MEQIFRTGIVGGFVFWKRSRGGNEAALVPPEEVLDRRGIVELSAGMQSRDRIPDLFILYT